MTQSREKQAVQRTHSSSVFLDFHISIYRQYLCQAWFYKCLEGKRRCQNVWVSHHPIFLAHYFCIEFVCSYKQPLYSLDYSLCPIIYNYEPYLLPAHVMRYLFLACFALHFTAPHEYTVALEYLNFIFQPETSATTKMETAVCAL